MARYAHHDIICPDGHRARLLLGDDEELPPCSHVMETHIRVSRLCNKPMHLLEDDEVTDGTHHVQGFKPFTYEGVYYSSQEEWSRNKAEIANNLKVPLEDLVESAPDRNKDRIKADEAAHRGYQNRRRAGYDEAMYRQRVKEERRKTGKDATIVVGWRGTR